MSLADQVACELVENCRKRNEDYRERTGAAPRVTEDDYKRLEAELVQVLRKYEDLPDDRASA